MIVANGLTFQYPGGGVDNLPLRDLSFECESAGITVGIGRSGVGKSTLMALLKGAYTKTDVVERFEGTLTIDGLLPEQLRGPKQISWVPQSPLLLDHLSVLDNIVLPASIRDRSEPGLERRIRAKAIELLERMGLTRCKDQRPRDLSGGMRTRVSLLRALVTEPRYLFLDEPFNGLDLFNRWEMYKLIREVRASNNLMTFLTTHDIPEAAILADRIVLVEEGKNNRTVVKVIPNQPVPLGAYAGGSGLEKARSNAVSIERMLDRAARACRTRISGLSRQARRLAFRTDCSKRARAEGSKGTECAAFSRPRNRRALWSQIWVHLGGTRMGH